VPGQECNFSALKRTQNVGVGRLAEGRLQAQFFHLGEARHRVQTAAADDPDFCSRQEFPQELDGAATKG
jgi:hypothetical protein